MEPFKIDIEVLQTCLILNDDFYYEFAFRVMLMNAYLFVFVSV